MRRLVPLLALAALVAAAAATAATPAQYRAQVNAMCRSYTPKMKAQETAMKQAQTANQPRAYGLALGKLLVLQLAEDRRIETTPVPAALKSKMTPITGRLKRVDTLIRAALAAASKGDSTTLIAKLRQVATVGAPVNKMLDAAGLRDCGSNQS